MRHGWTLLVVAILGFAPSQDVVFGRENQSPLPDTQLGRRTAPILLLTRVDVQADLRMRAEQISSADAMVTRLWLQASALKGKQNDPAAKQAAQTLNREMNGWIDTQLSAEQKARLVQIDLQWEGPSALASREVVAATLNLSREQREAILQASLRCNAARREGKDEERTLAETTLSTLTPEQRQTWKELLGPPFVPKITRVVGPEAKLTR